MHAVVISGGIQIEIPDCPIAVGITGEQLKGTCKKIARKFRFPVSWSAVVTGKINELTKSKISSNI
jgi:hypothetical protein